MFIKRFIEIIIMTMILICCLGITSVFAQDSYYYGLGKQPLYLNESIISIKFSPDMQPQYCEIFAYMIEALDESYPPEPMYIGFDIYHVRKGYDIIELQAALNERSDVLYAYPSYYDSYGTPFNLNDQFNIRYMESVSQAVIDSIESFYSVELINGPSEYTGLRSMRVTPDSPGTCLDVANAFYESGLVYYSHPDFANVELHNDQQTNTEQDNYYYGLGQQPLYKCDSIITIKFDPSVPSQHSSDFVHMVEAIDETYAPEPMYVGFDVYHIENGHNIDSLLDVLNDRQDILRIFIIL